MIAGMLNSVELAGDSDLADDVAEIKKVFRCEFLCYTLCIIRGHFL